MDKRYKQYYHQMQIVVSSFDVIAGCGAAKPYTALALQTISRHFRCVRDAISVQILVIRKSLGGEHDGLDRKSLCLNSYVFENSELSYPKDSDKIMLARQTGLSRGQVLHC